MFLAFTLVNYHLINCWLSNDNEHTTKTLYILTYIIFCIVLYCNEPVI